MLKPLLNRDSSGAFKLPEDGYYHVVPPGNWPHSSGFTQLVDDKSIQAILNAFGQDKAKKAVVHDDGVLLADYDHFSNDADKPSEAAGWIEDLQNRADGLYAKIRWSDDGKKAVEGGRYRYVSPVWNREDVEKIDDKTIRPLRLDRVGLTNDPNIKGMKPLSNRKELDPAPAIDDEPVKQIAHRGPIKNYGTSEGARKGWETRRGGAGADKAATKKGISDKEHAANEAKLSRKERFKLKEKAQTLTTTKAAADAKYRQLAAKAVSKQGEKGEPSAPSAKPAAGKSNLKISLPKKPEAPLKISVPKTDGGQKIESTPNEENKAKLERFAAQAKQPPPLPVRSFSKPPPLPHTSSSGGAGNHVHIHFAAPTNHSGPDGSSLLKSNPFGHGFGNRQKLSGRYGAARIARKPSRSVSNHAA